MEFEIGFLTITIKDFVDIAIVAILFFWLYKALKDTIAVQILFGLMIIIGLKFIAEALSFKSLNWILTTISNIWLLAFIILFQPELRKLLLLITRTPLFKLFVKSKISKTIDVVIDAAQKMSEKHIGALLVFTRTQNVQMTIETGILINGTVSKELILSIFNTKSPLHDGAVIIDNDLILAASCILPLSPHERVNERRNLGTRHRAALGLSEQVDVIVLVVSEETGGISIADGGNMIFDIPKDKLPVVLNAKFAEN